MLAVYLRRICYLISLVLSCLIIPQGNASVTLTGSRIIYPGNANSVDLQLKNNDAFPYVIQTWFDDGNLDEKPEAANSVPFIALPAVFRIQPKSGQVIRIVKKGEGIFPQDRESAFWFNVLQIPPANISADMKKNKILVTLRTRVKLFYRPSSVSAPDHLLQGLIVNARKEGKSGLAIEIQNNQPWYASLSQLQVIAGGVTYSVDSEMVAPFSTRVFPLQSGIKIAKGNAKVVVTVVNDQGARVSEHYAIFIP